MSEAESRTLSAADPMRDKMLTVSKIYDDDYVCEEQMPKAPKIEKINAYIEKNIEYYKTLADSMEDDRKPEWEPLEACFRKIL